MLEEEWKGREARLCQQSRLDRECLTVESTDLSLRHYEREIFRENRFLGLSHGIVATGPAILVALVCLRLSLTPTHLLTWLLPGIAYLGAYALLATHLPRRETLRERARQALHDDRVLKARQLELRVGESDVLG